MATEVPPDFIRAAKEFVRITNGLSFPQFTGLTDQRNPKRTKAEDRDHLGAGTSTDGSFVFH